MSVIRWPEPFNEQGRLDEGEAAGAMGKSALAGEPSDCRLVLHVNLFFDGTNNNREWDTKNVDRPTHSNVARLFRACPQKKRQEFSPSTFLVLVHRFMKLAKWFSHLKARHSPLVSVCALHGDIPAC